MTTQRLYLSPIKSEDITFIHQGLSDHDITEYYDVHFDTLEETKEQMEWYDSLIKTGTGAWWGIYLKKNDRFCGAAGFNNLEKEHGKAEIGMWLLKDFWGQGILKEIMPKLFEIGFDQLNLHRIEGYVVSDNEKCKSALAKIDFKYEGTMRECEIKNGQRISVDIYAILKKEWEEITQSS